MATGDQALIGHPAVDFICVGEGEQCLKELLDQIGRETGLRRYDMVPYLVDKQHGEIIGNPPAPLLDVVSLARPDHRLYDRYPPIARGRTGTFTFMRGCRFNCSFCFNHAFQKLYGNRPHLVRRRSPESSISEIEETMVARNGKVKIFHLSSDIRIFLIESWGIIFLGDA